MPNTNFITIIKAIDELFPSKSKLDYTKVSPNELSTKVINKFRELKIEVNEEELKKIIEEYQGLIYKKDHYVFNNYDKNRGFDQEHYFIQQTISNMKYKILQLLKTEQYGVSNELYDIRKFGNEQEIRKEINPEKITEYIIDTLTITKEENDIYDSSTGITRIIARDILSHYGLNNNETFSEIDENEEKIATLIDEVFRKTRVYKGDSQLIDGFEVSKSGAIQNDQKYQSEIKKATKEIIQIVSLLAEKAIRNGVKREEQKSQKNNKEREFIFPQSEAAAQLFGKRNEKRTYTSPKEEKTPEEIEIEELRKKLFQLEKSQAEITTLIAETKEILAQKESSLTDDSKSIHR